MTVIGDVRNSLITRYNKPTALFSVVKQSKTNRTKTHSKTWFPPTQRTQREALAYILRKRRRRRNSQNACVWRRVETGLKPRKEYRALRTNASHREALTLIHNAIMSKPMQAYSIRGASVREFVFYVFFRFQKNMTFYVFLEMTCQKNVKSR